jgi:hypothetical protein
MKSNCFEVMVRYIGGKARTLSCYASGHWLALKKFFERSVQFPKGPWGCRGKFVVELRGERCEGGSARLIWLFVEAKTVQKK